MSQTIRIVGLGPGDPALRSIRADELLRSGKRVLLRTGVHPGLEDLLLLPEVSTCDDLYQTESTFAEVYQRIAERVVSAAREDDEVVYAVPGSPMFGEATVGMIRELADAHGIAVDLVPSVSGLEACAAAIPVDLMTAEVQVLDGTTFAQLASREPFAGAPFFYDVTRPALIFQVYSTQVAAAVKQILERLLPADHPTTVIQATGVADQQRLASRTLAEIGILDADHLTSLWIPPLEPAASWRTPMRLHQLIAALRSPEGCPWDREQTHETLRPKVLEEAYEVADAIESGEDADVANELGDLLLLVALLAQIAEEDGAFSIEDVYEQVNRKLVRRHPHVFGDATAETPSDVVTTWRGVKEAERRARGDESPELDPFERLPRSMPILERLQRVMRNGQDGTGLVGPEDLGDRLLALAEEAIEAGYDPGLAIEHAYRRKIKLGAAP